MDKKSGEDNKENEFFVWIRDEWFFFYLKINNNDIFQGLDTSDVSHIILQPQTVVIPGGGQVGGQSKPDLDLATLEVKTALARVYKHVRKPVPHKLQKMDFWSTKDENIQS